MPRNLTFTAFRRTSAPLIWLLLLYFPLEAQRPVPGFTHYGTTQPGVSSLTVIKAYEDHRGLMWFCTSNGANFFNGKEIQVFSHNPLDTNSIASSVVTSMQQDDQHRYWFAGIDGLTLYDPNAPSGQQFKRRYKKTDSKPGLPGDQIQFLLYDGDDYMWASTLKIGLMKIHIHTLEAEVIDLKLPESEKVTDGTGIFYDAREEKMYLAANTNGIIGIDIRTNAITNYRHQIDSILSSRTFEAPIDFRVSNVFRDHEGTFWMTTRGNDLIAWNASKKYSQVWRFGIVKESGDRIFPVAEDAAGNIWFGFPLKGLFILHKASGQVSHYLNHPNDPASLAHNTINHIMKDHHGVMWLSTYKGVNKFDPAEQPFQYTRPYLERGPNEDAPPIKGYYEDSEGNEWLGTEAGLLFYPKDSSGYLEIPVKGIQDNNLVINAMTDLPGQRLLLGTGIGLYEYDKQTRKTTPYVWNDCDLCNEKTRGGVWRFLKDTINGVPHIWIGSQKYGLQLLNAQTKEIFLAPIQTDSTKDYPDYLVWDIEKDRKGNIWAATRSGIRKVDSFSPWRFSRPDKLEGDTTILQETEIRDICFDAGNNLYAVMRGGLLIQKDRRYINALTLIPGMNPKSFNVAPDANGHIWILTASEYIRYEPETNRYSIYDSRIVNRGQFGVGAFHLTENRKLIYRNAKQITRIDPDTSLITRQPPRTFITDFLLFDTSRVEMLGQESLKLNHDQNGITIEFASDNYTFAELNQFKWKLDGIDRDWVTIRNRNFALYSALPPGEYTFHVHSRNADGLWDEQGAKFSFTIAPPWYLTWWFKLFMALAGAGLIAYIVHQRTQRLLLKQRIEIEKKMALEQERSRISKDMHDDLGSGLSAIHLMSNYLKENTSQQYPEFSEDIEKIRKSSEDLNQRIREIIWTVNTKDDTLESLLIFLQRYAGEMSEQSHIPIHVHAPDNIPDITLNGLQRKHLFLAAKEAVNNSLKHGHPTQIDITLQAGPGKEISLSVKDNGHGFNPEHPNGNGSGNGMSNMKYRMSEIGGKMEVNSSGQGTSVSFSIKA